MAVQVESEKDCGAGRSRPAADIAGSIACVPSPLALLTRRVAASSVVPLARTLK
jgi:hypothetical protein